MINVLSTCNVVIGRRTEFEEAFKELIALYDKHGAKLVGFWWTIGGEGNEALWINTWKDIGNYEKGNEEARNDKDYPLERIASTVITYTDKILKPSTLSPLK